MKKSTCHFLLISLCLLTSPQISWAQHATAFDVEAGDIAFQNSCANCHGPDGDMIDEVDLGHGVFRTLLSDDNLVSIILNGIPNTPMPPSPNMSEEQAREIVAYLRSLAITESSIALGGDAEQGKTLFEETGNCLSCHRVNGTGSRLGPDLSRIGTLRPRTELEASLLDPKAEVQANNRFYTVLTQSGERVTGRLLNHDTFTVMLIDSNENLRSFEKSALRSHGFTDAEMPSLRDNFSAQEIADLVEYLISLRG